METQGFTIPIPPGEFFDDDPFNLDKIFIPAPEINTFVADAILAEASPLYNEEHIHLTTARIGFLWTAVPNKRNMRRVVGEAEILNFKGGAWQKARQEKQIVDWFGGVPDFVVTLDAGYVAGECGDVEFLALLEHELYHCGQAVDEFGFPKFRQSDGRPIFGIRGHDVEEFTGIIRRYGVGAASQNVRDMITAAAEKPTFPARKISQLCGVCS